MGVEDIFPKDNFHKWHYLKSNGGKGHSSQG